MKTLATLLLFFATNAHAGHVLYYSDSIGSALNGTPTIMDLLLAQRPDLTGCNDSYPGRDTDDGVTGVQTAMAPGCVGLETDVIVVLGINDPLSVDSDPKEAAKRLRQIGAKIRAKGAREWLVPPLPCLSNRGLPLDFQEYRRQIRYWLAHMNGAGVSYNVIDAADEFTETPWDVCAADGVHPAGAAGLPCRQKVADYLATVIP